MRATVLLIGGTHGAGKTTLGEALSSELAWPLVSRDRVRGGLAWTEQEAAIVPGGALSRRAVAVFFEIIELHVTNGVSVVADSPFRRGISETDLDTVLDLADVRMVHCTITRDLAIERAATRNGREFVADMLAGRDEARWARVEQPLDLPVPLVVVDTSDGYAPTLDAIVAFARGAI